MAGSHCLLSLRFMFKTVLIGYDEPERGGEAIALANVLRDPREGTLLLASAYPLAPPTADGVVPPDELAELRDETNEMLAKARDGLRDPASAQICAVASDSPGRQLREAAEADHADLVVVGSGRRSALGRPLPGTAAERVLDDPICPVAVAPPGYSGGDIRRIGVAYDGSPAADTALRAAESLAVEHGASLTVYRVDEPALRPGAPIAAGTGSNSAQLGLRPETLILDGVPAEEIAGRAYGVVDLLFVGACGHGPLRGALLENVSGAVVRAAGCPVVVTPRGGVAPRHSPNAATATASRASSS
jgi:nucleotide-binding universal stress UspA family protein